MEDDVFGALDGLEGLADQVLPGLDQHLDGHIVRDVAPLDQLAADLILGLTGGGKADLDLLDADVHQGVKIFQLLLQVHGVHQSLVAVPQVHRTPDGGLGDDAVRPGAALDGLGLEGMYFLISGFHMGCLLYILRGQNDAPDFFQVRGVGNDAVPPWFGRRLPESGPHKPRTRLRPVTGPYVSSYSQIRTSCSGTSIHRGRTPVPTNHRLSEGADPVFFPVTAFVECYFSGGGRLCQEKNETDLKKAGTN